MIDWQEVKRRAASGNPKPEQRVEKAESEWRQQLEPEVFEITRLSATERPFSSELCNRFGPGEYHCACCHVLLFDAGEKFDSGTGWPSFTQPSAPSAVAYRQDTSHGADRIECLCATCDAHLGHVFPDGPEPSGLRYCINALALTKHT